MKNNILIIGAGASGLLCAIRLKCSCPSCSVTVLERMPRAGKKLLATGNGRCNLSNRCAETAAYFGDGTLAHTVIEKYNVEKTLDFFLSLGLLTRSDSEGRIYPYAMQSAGVLEILTLQCQRLGVKIITDCTVTAVKKKKGFEVYADKGVFTCDVLVFACGGKSAPELGSNGSCYEIISSLGHTVIPPFPALVQMKSSSKYPRLLSGIRHKCKISLEIDGEIRDEKSGEVLFTDYGLSGICTMQLSRHVHESEGARVAAVLDLVPEMGRTELSALIETSRAALPESETWLTGLLPGKLPAIIARQGKNDPALMAEITKNWRLIITGTLGFKFSQVTAGGIDTGEINSETLESRLIDSLYFCGEVLNVDGDSGGFNLQWCWSSALNAADSIIQKKEL